MKTYWQSAVCGLLDWGVDLFWFEAFDEPKKADAVGTNGETGKRAALGLVHQRPSAKVQYEVLDSVLSDFGRVFVHLAGETNAAASIGRNNWGLALCRLDEVEHVHLQSPIQSTSKSAEHTNNGRVH